MALSRRTVLVIIGLVIVALSGLVVVQVALLRTAFDQKEQAFAGNVRAALSRVAQQLLAREAIHTALAIDSPTCIPSADSVRIAILSHKSAPGADSPCLPIGCDSTAGSMPEVWVSRDTLYYSVPSPQRIVIRTTDSTLGGRHIYVDSFRSAGEYSVSLTGSEKLVAKPRFISVFRSDSGVATVEIGADSLARMLGGSAQRCSTQVFITAIMSQLIEGGARPMGEQVDTLALDSLVRANLRESGIDLDYAYGVVTRRDDSLYFPTPIAYAREIKRSDLSAPLFPHDIFSQGIDLLIYFPGRRAFVWQQMGPLLIPTVILMTILVGCFAYTIRTILTQRRFAGLVVDFINNMTHEFKTPLSTVQLAADAIKRADVVADPEKVLRFNRMIQDETQRMRNQTDKILQMAVLEQGDYELKMSDVDVHQVITRAAQALALRVESRRGSVVTRLTAKRFTLRADAVHFAGVIENLLDNACKYTLEDPVIEIATEDTDGGLKISIADNGIGIKPEHQKMIFEKYFRVPSGNIHNVKGFGLGLSYVRLIVLAHGGTVTLASAQGEGTRVDLLFPIQPVAEGQGV